MASFRNSIMRQLTAKPTKIQRTSMDSSQWKLKEATVRVEPQVVPSFCCFCHIIIFTANYRLFLNSLFCSFFLFASFAASRKVAANGPSVQTTLASSNSNCAISYGNSGSATDHSMGFNEQLTMAVFKLQHSLDRVVNRIDALESVLSLQSVSEEPDRAFVQLALTNWSSIGVCCSFTLIDSPVDCFSSIYAEMSSRERSFHATECHFQMAFPRAERQDDGLCDCLATCAFPRAALREADTQKVNSFILLHVRCFRLTRVLQLLVG